MKKPTLVIPSLDRLAQILADQEQARRRAWRDAGRKGAASREANRKARQKAHSVPKTDQRQRKRKLALSAWKVLCARMEAGCWYGVPELRALMPEYAEKTVRVEALELVTRGLAEKGRNADHDPALASGQVEPTYLYRLTEAGEAAAIEFREALRPSEIKGE